MEEAESRPLVIHVEHPTLERVSFKVLPSCRLERIFRRYAQVHGLEAGAMRFAYRFKGSSLLDDSATVGSLAMQDGDAIQAEEAQPRSRPRLRLRLKNLPSGVQSRVRNGENH